MRQPGRHDQDLPERNQRRGIRQVDRARRPEDVELHAQDGEQAGQRSDEARHAQPVVEEGIESAHGHAGGDRHDDRAGHRPAAVHPENADQRGREAAHRTDRKVDLAEHQHTDDAERNDADRRAVEEQVDEIVRSQKDRVQAREHDGDQDEADDDRQHAEVARFHPVDEAPEGVDHSRFVAHPLIAAIERRWCCTVVGCSWALLRGVLLGGFANLPARDRVFGRAGYGGDKFVV